jgi:hypothetical protein
MTLGDMHADGMRSVAKSDLEATIAGRFELRGVSL